MNFIRYLEAFALVTFVTLVGFVFLEVLGWNSIYSTLTAGLVGTTCALIFSDAAKFLYEIVKKDSRTPALDVSVIFGLMLLGLYAGIRLFMLIRSSVPAREFHPLGGHWSYDVLSTIASFALFYITVPSISVLAIGIGFIAYKAIAERMTKP